MIRCTRWMEGFTHSCCCSHASVIILQQFFDTQENDVKEMMFQVHLKAMQLDADYEMGGKSIDEL